MKKLFKTAAVILISPLLIPYYSEKRDQYKTDCAKNGEKILKWRLK